MNSINDEFIQKLASEAQEILNPKDKSVVLVIQMIIGGGAFKSNGDKKVDGITVTSIPFRNTVHYFVFDIFYNTAFDPDAEKKAIQYQ